MDELPVMLVDSSEGLVEGWEMKTGSGVVDVCVLPPTVLCSFECGSGDVVPVRIPGSVFGAFVVISVVRGLVCSL